MVFFSNFIFANDNLYTTSAVLNISLMITNICKLNINKNNINFNVVSVNRLKKQNGNIKSIPITVTCTGGYDNENIGLSFKPVGSNGHFGLPSSGILNTTTKNLGILLTTSGNAFDTANSGYVNNRPLVFYSPYIIPSNKNNNVFTINAQPVMENMSYPIKSGKFTAGMVVTLTYE